MDKTTEKKPDYLTLSLITLLLVVFAAGQWIVVQTIDSRIESSEAAVLAAVGQAKERSATAAPVAKAAMPMPDKAAMPTASAMPAASGSAAPAASGSAAHAASAAPAAPAASAAPKK